MRLVLYVAHCVRPTADEIAAFVGDPALAASRATRANVSAAMHSLSWLRHTFSETTFIAPWITSIQCGDDDADPAQRESGLIDCCAVVERCDGIVLCGPRMSNGMRREMEHGMRVASRCSYIGDGFEVYDLIGYSIEGASCRNEDCGSFNAWMAYRESCTR